MKWISVKDKRPTKEDSPILALDTLSHFSIKSLQYLDRGWDGAGWYDSSTEYGMGLNESEAHFHENQGILYWMPLPQPPEKE